MQGEGPVQSVDTLHKCHWIPSELDTPCVHLLNLHTEQSYTIMICWANTCMCYLIPIDLSALFKCCSSPVWVKDYRLVANKCKICVCNLVPINFIAISLGVHRQYGVVTFLFGFKLVTFFKLVAPPPLCYVVLIVFLVYDFPRWRILFPCQVCPLLLNLQLIS